MMKQSKIFVVAICLTAVFLNPLTASALPRSLAELKDIPDELTQTGIVHGDIPSINTYTILPMNEALMSLEPDDPVFIVPLPDAVHIYPQKVLVWHEVVNEVIKGEPYCISYSPLSGSLAVYYARADQQNLIFDADGRLFNSNTTITPPAIQKIILPILPFKLYCSSNLLAPFMHSPFPILC